MQETIHGVDPEHLPAVWFIDAKLVLDCGDTIWRRKWKEYFQFRVFHWAAAAGVRINLESLLIAVFPKLKNDPVAIAELSLKFLAIIRQEHGRKRDRAREKRQRKREEAERNGGQ